MERSIDYLGNIGHLKESGDVPRLYFCLQNHHPMCNGALFCLHVLRKEIYGNRSPCVG